MLSLSLSRTVNDGLISGIRIKRNFFPHSCIFFADDSLLFLKVDLRECSNVKDLLNSYCRASGQCINFSKSEICFSKACNPNIVNAVCLALNVKKAVDNPKYLGLRLLMGRSKK